MDDHIVDYEEYYSDREYYDDYYDDDEGSSQDGKRMSDEMALHNKESVLFQLDVSIFELPDGFPISTMQNPGIVDINEELERTREYWKKVPLEMRQDPEVAAMALTNHVCRLKDLPQCFHNDYEFLLSVVREKLGVWHFLPNEIRLDPEFVRMIKSFSDLSDLSDIFEQIPILRSDLNLWSSIWESVIGEDGEGDQEEFVDLFRRYASEHVRTNADFMLSVIAFDNDMYRELVNNTSLCQDGKFMARLLETCPTVLILLSPDTQIRFPDLVARTFESYFNKLKIMDRGLQQKVEISESLARSIARDLWSNRVVVRAWFHSGAAIFHETIFPDAWRSNKTIFRWIADYTGQRGFTKAQGYDLHLLLQLSFGCASSSLRNDVAFMEQAIRYNWTLFCFLPQPLQQDFEMLLLAAARSSRFCRHFLEIFPSRANRDVLCSTREKVADLLLSHKVFLRQVICPIDLSQPSTQVGGNLGLLNQGLETTGVFKKLIAEYAGVPIGAHFRLLRRASEHLNLPSGLDYLLQRHDWLGKDQTLSDEDESFVSLSQVACVMHNRTCTQREAVLALKANNNDLVKTLMSMSWCPPPP